MNLKKDLESKQKELQQKVEQFNSLRETLNNLNAEILQISGAIKILQELINKKGDK